MRADDSSTDRKAKAHSLGFCGKERLKYLFQFLPGNAAPLVGDGYNHCAAAVLDFSTNKQPALCIIAISHRVASIDYQVEQNLLKLHRVAGHHRQIPGEFSIYSDMLIYKIATD